ncbi:MAG: nuclear transport factor 2 family protein [Chloroflexi bacterium]|nr:nuclear transport factor 2 family protein [Chloroflexota bacterium]
MTADTDEAVLAANAAFYSAFATRDMTAMDELWAREAPVACTHPGWPVLTGRDDVLASWRGILDNPAAPNIQVTETVVHRFGDAALVFCLEVVDGGPVAATNVFVREGDAWRMVHHHAGPVTTVMRTRFAGPVAPAPDRRN